MTNYTKKLKDPRWQKKRLEIFERDEWVCQGCFDSESTLNIHHRRYLPDKEPWDYPDNLLVTLCDVCHLEEKELRPDIESDLIEVLREYFLIQDLSFLVQEFRKIKMCHSEGVVASIIGWVATDENLQKELIGRYFESLKLAKKIEADEVV